MRKYFRSAAKIHRAGHFREGLPVCGGKNATKTKTAKEKSTGRKKSEKDSIIHVTLCNFAN